MAMLATIQSAIAFCLVISCYIEHVEAASLRHTAHPSKGSRAVHGSKRCKYSSDKPLTLLSQNTGDLGLAPAPAVAGSEGVFGDVGVFSDGFSRVGCEVDSAPDSQRLYFNDHACGEVSSCRLTELPMTPRLCFDFCRQYEHARFFGLMGSKCYCSTYFHIASKGGEGTCSFACEGDPDEMCGGPSKSSLFEMHMCGDSMDEAQAAGEMGAKAAAMSTAAVQIGNETVGKIRGLVGAWQLDVCSVKPEGERVCSLTSAWLDSTAPVLDAVYKTDHAFKVLAAAGNKLTTLAAKAAQAGSDVDAATASELELTTEAVRDAAAKAEGEAGTVKLLVGGLAGPVGGGSNLTSFDSVFKALGDTENGWHALCALVPIDGEIYSGMAEDDPATCATRCLQLSSGTQACMAFNYQYWAGLASCQLLTAGGLVDPASSLVKAVPIFEVSNSKRDAMGITSLDCYAHGAFMAGHPRGPLKTEVIRSITA